MRQQTKRIFKKNVFKRELKTYAFMVLSFYYLSGENVKSDSTFFPDDTPEALHNTDRETSNAIKEWAELTPPTKEMETEKVVSPKQAKPKDIGLVHPQTPTPGNNVAHKQESESILTVTPESETPVISKEQKPTSIIALTPDSKASASSKKQEPLQLTTVKPHPKALPVHEKDQASLPSKEQHASLKPIVSYLDAASGRSPLAMLEPTQEVSSQRWYIYSSAMRGLKNPSDGIQIVSMEEGRSPHRGEEVRNLLKEMGVESEKIQLIQAKGEQNQTGIIYIFAGK